MRAILLFPGRALSVSWPRPGVRGAVRGWPDKLRAAWILYAALALFSGGCIPGTAYAQQQTFTWQQIRDQFEATNPTLLADKLNVDESKAQEITAFLRPNPTFTLSTDGTQLRPYQGEWQPLRGTSISPNISYLHERQHKRELRAESAKKGTLIAESSHADLDRTLLFNLRSAFVSILQAKAVLQLAKDNLAYYDHVLDISRDRFNAGDIAQIDLDRLELQRVQYESDLQAAEESLEDAQIQLLTLLNDRTPIDQFDVIGAYDFNDQLLARDEFRKIAMETRPDLKAAVEAIDKAQTDHKLAIANGSTDPTFAVWWTHNPSFNNHLTKTRWASASAFLCAFLTGTRERSCGRSLKSRGVKSCATPPKRRCSVTWTPATPPLKAIWFCCDPTRLSTCSNPFAFETRFSFLTSMVEHRCSTS
jgi:Outer membrane efflux protein